MAMQIGEAARKAGVNLRTLRYYERLDLLRPVRTASNYRVYSEEMIRRVCFIKRAQQLGFTLEEIKELLALRVGSKRPCTGARRRAEAKIDEIEGKIEALRAMKGALERLTAACSGQGTVGECPILESLDGNRKGRRA